jgi:anthranilate phosphoribosyltransferase
MIKSALAKLMDGTSLTQSEAYEVMCAVMSGQCSHAQIGALLACLRMKRETVDELTGFALAMRQHALKVHTHRRPLVDTCGTGGDTLDTFNISTAAALAVSASGVAVAKHGNRAVSSRCGSADVLRAVGVNLELPPEAVGDCIDEIGIGFLFAPMHHPSMANVAEPRRELGVRTIFNLLGPLTNPAGADRQVIGVYDPELVPKLAETLHRLGVVKAMVVHGAPGLDEVSTLGETRICVLSSGSITETVLTPSDLGVAQAQPNDVAGAGDVQGNAQILQAILAGETGPRHDIVCVNAAAALIAADAAETWQQGVETASQALTDGAAARRLQELVNWTAGAKPVDG